MQLIAHQELASAAASITFSSIPQTFTDLYLKVSGRCDRNVFSFSYVYLQFNSSGSGYTYRALQGDGSSVNSYNQATGGLTTVALIAGGVSQANNTADTFGNSGFYIPNYTGSTAKSVSVDGVSETNATGATAQITAGLWSGTDAITQIEIKPWQSGSLFNWTSGTSATLYGILAGSDGIVTVS
jgi:hypothetical protein